VTEKPANRKLDGCAEDGRIPVDVIPPIGANAKKAALLTSWDLFDESDARRAVEFANEACQSAEALMR